MEDITHVLHLAAKVSVQASVDDPSMSCSTKIGGCVNVLQVARFFRVQQIVYASRNQKTITLFSFESLGMFLRATERRHARGRRKGSRGGQ